MAKLHKKRSVYQLRSTRLSKSLKKGHGLSKFNPFKSKADKASKGMRPAKKAPNRPVYRDHLDSSTASSICESDLALVIRQDEPRKFNEIPDS